MRRLIYSTIVSKRHGGNFGEVYTPDSKIKINKQQSIQQKKFDELDRILFKPEFIESLKQSNGTM